jgi:hypothetical protein
MLAFVKNSIIRFLTDIGMCISNACENGGTCYEMVNGYGCACPAGYTGKTCEIGKKNNICHMYPINFR